MALVRKQNALYENLSPYKLILIRFVNQVNQVSRVNQPSPTKSTYRSEIDGLRAFAVLSVVAFHAFPSWLKGGFIGVDVFFVISGFLISTHILENLDNGRFSFADFFARRIRRIFPALILVMACSLAFGWFSLLADEYAQLGKHVASGAAFIANFILVNENDYFDNAAETKPMLHLWSLAVEEQFYIVWPLVLWFACKRKFNPLSIIIIIALSSFYLNLHFVKSHPTETFFLPAGRFWELLSGSLLAWFLLYKAEMLAKFTLWTDKHLASLIHLEDIEADGSIAYNAMSLFGLLLLSYGVLFIDKSLKFPSGWALIPVVGTVLVIASGSKARLNRVFLMNSPAVWFGLISYPLYLWHWPILSFQRILDGKIPHRDARIGAVLLSILLAWLTYRFVEKAIRFGNPKAIRSSVLIFLIGVVGTFGLFIKNNGGFTPYNIALTHISEAKGDWEYPKGLISRNGYWVTSNKPSKVVMFGDSHIQAFGPRIVEMYKRGLIKDVAFVTNGGCAPIPNLYRSEKYLTCDANFKHLEEALLSEPIETVILGGSYGSSFNNKESFFVQNGGERLSLASEQGRSQAAAAFYTFVERLAKSYKVVVLSHAASSNKFSPSYILNSDEARRAIPLGSSVNNAPFIIDNKLEIEMEGWIKPLNVPYVSQSKKVCPNGICLPLTEDGRPKYKDGSHMRPFFVKEYMDVLDPYILLSN